MKWRSLAVPVVILAWAALASSVVLLDAGNPIRSLLVLPFLLAGPGLALVPFLRITGLPGLVMAVGLSLALDAIVPTMMIYTGVWSPDTTFAVLVGLTLIGAAAQLVVELLKPALPAGDLQ